MSIETRQALVNNPKLVLKAASQKEDLLNPNLTNTWLIAFLIDLVSTCKRPILITAIRTDHASGTLHNPYGRAIDCWNADWATNGDDKVIDVMQAAAIVGAKYKPALVEVGLSGTAAYFKHYVTWPLSNVFIEDYGKNNEHLHLAVGTPQSKY